MKRAMLFGAIGLVFVLAAAPAGTIWSWGSETDGLQTNVPEGDDFVQVAAGAKHSLALRADGTIVGWGSNLYGQINIPDFQDFVAIAAGGDFSIGLRSNGEVVTWGRNNYSQVSGKPAGGGFVAIAAGNNHGVAIRANGSAVAWGLSSSFTGLAAMTDYLAVAGGGYHTVALRGAGPTGSVVNYGATWDGLGDVPAGNDFVAVEAGVDHSLALRADGTLAAWGLPSGANDYGQVTATPQEGGFSKIAAGDRFNVALKTDGTLVAWGRWSSGQTNVPMGDGFVAIAAGGAHALAIREQSSLVVNAPNGGEAFRAGSLQTITWTTVGTIANVVIEYSTDNGQTWVAVTPANEGNTGVYEWRTPDVDSQECLVRVSSASGFVADVSDAPFTIYPCPLKADLTGDCVVDFADFAIMASEWLLSDSPEEPETNPADFDLNGKVDWQDLEALAIRWLQQDAGTYDLDGESPVNMKDFAMFADNWGWQR